MAMGAEKIWVNHPARLGPPTSAMPIPVNSRAVPAVSSSAGRITGRYDCEAISKKTDSVPTRKAMASSSSMRSSPSQAVRGTSSNSAARPMSAAIITGRLARRSTQTPVASPNSRIGIDPAATSNPI
jgi:hypothetical protein